MADDSAKTKEQEVPSVESVEQLQAQTEQVSSDASPVLRKPEVNGNVSQSNSIELIQEKSKISEISEPFDAKSPKTKDVDVEIEPTEVKKDKAEIEEEPCAVKEVEEKSNGLAAEVKQDQVKRVSPVIEIIPATPPTAVKTEPEPEKETKASVEPVVEKPAASPPNLPEVQQETSPKVR